MFNNVAIYNPKTMSFAFIVGMSTKMATKCFPEEHKISGHKNSWELMLYSMFLVKYS